MKIIALIPFKNEEWILPTCLASLKNVCDDIICIDDNSTDNSKKIALSFGCKVYDNDKLVNVGWSEHYIRENLLKLGRESNGTHFICLDADEALTAQFSINARKILNNLKPGQKLTMQWLALWKSLNHYRDDRSVWSNNYKDFIVCDDQKISYPYQWLHVGRTPGINNDETLLRLNMKFGGVMHYQFSNWNNFQIKQCYLRCAELIKKPNLHTQINQQYSITLDDPNALVTEMPEEWYKNYPLPDIFNIVKDWRFERINSYFEEYGPEYFEKLNIWHLNELRQIFINKVGREPR